MLYLLNNLYFMNLFFYKTNINKLIIINFIYLKNNIAIYPIKKLLSSDQMINKINYNRYVNKELVKFIEINDIKIPNHTKQIINNPMTSWKERYCTLLTFL